jgi:hypothetical protein
MREVVPFLMKCYEAAMPTLGADHLSIRAHFTILGDRDVGAIIDAKQLFDENDKPLPSKLDDCLRSTLQTLELPPLGDGSAVEVARARSQRDADSEETDVKLRLVGARAAINTRCAQLSV